MRFPPFSAILEAMESDSSSTRVRLAEITDEGRFESLAAAVLRQAEPSYRHLIETGTNAQGKPIASPVDGLMLVPHSSPPHLICFHHTTTAQKRLREKWLAIDGGDLPKTARWAATRRDKLPKAKVTLVLTTNRRVPPDLYTEVQAEAAAHNLGVDIWDQSLIANHLDNTAEGQWLRRSLGVQPTRLSRWLLNELSSRSLDAQTGFENSWNRVVRKLDAELSEAVRAAADTLFLVAESGQGKSSAVRALLQNHVQRGGYGLVISPEDLENSVTIDGTIELALRKLAPSLVDGSGAAALAIATPEFPLLLAIEDINAANRPSALIERLVGWCRLERSSEASAQSLKQPWRILCPLRPQALDRLSEQARKLVLNRSLVSGPFTTEEGTAAVLRRAGNEGANLTSIQARDIAISLGLDPLMIALRDPGEPSSVAAVIGEFVTRGLSRASANTEGLGPSDFRDGLFKLSCKMLCCRVLVPKWSDLLRWFHDDAHSLRALGILASNRTMVWRLPLGDDDALTFRHDRVRDYLLADAIARLMETNSLPNATLSDPFYAELLGAALASMREISSIWVTRAREANPLALVFAFRLLNSQRGSSANANLVVSNIRTWLNDLSAHSANSQHLTWAIASTLATIDSPLVAEFSQSLNGSGWPILEARFRNGDAIAGAVICHSFGPGTTFPWRDHLIEHVVSRHGQQIVAAVENLLRAEKSGKIRIGALHLAGFIGANRLLDAVSAAWQTFEKYELGAFIWAAARCGEANAKPLLDSICSAWASLPDDNSSTSKNTVAAFSARNGISRQGLPDPVISYFLERTAFEDLAWPITYMLHGVDHPDVMEYMVKTAGVKWEFGFSIFCRDWDIYEHNPGRHLSEKSLERLRQIWSNGDGSAAERRRAFLLWSGSAERDSLHIVRDVDTDSPLYPDALRVRLLLKDSESFEPFKRMLESAENRGYWWQFARNIWLPGLTNLLESELESRRDHEACHSGREYPTDWIISELLQILPSSDAERLLRKNWSHLRLSYQFIQTALFVATPSTRELAAQSLKEHPRPAKLLQFTDHHYRLHGHDDLKADEHRLNSLIPYLGLLEPSSIKSFWDGCNRLGHFKWRRENLDNLLSAEDRRREALDKEDLYVQLDAKADETHSHGDLWLERFERRGESARRGLTVALEWLQQRRTLRALKLTADILVSAGTRHELALLQIDDITPASEVREIIADTKFALFRRTLS
ncbi:hypothetical protein [Bradyrhizobium genosp. P]|uniref:hypothetical protein n=1 Tax=Bradyrhizobium genosp. P TaxID=83641 RepID=UPI003CF781AC